MSINRPDSPFFTVLDQIIGITGDDAGDRFLAHVVEQYGLTHAAYLGVNIPRATHGEHYVQCTYTNSWVERYLTENYVNIDPIVSQGFDRVLPLDWSHARDHAPAARRLFRDAEDGGIGRHGLTFPLRGRMGEKALFSINADVSDTEWFKVKPLLLRDFQAISVYFHARVLEVHGHNVIEDIQALSPRQREALRWVASGKTAWETSEIMSISERAVNFHLNQARAKLNCLTTTQAVAKALTQGLLHLH